MTRVVHIAGQGVGVETQYRQRCAWCGEVLVDGDAANEMVAPGSGPRSPFFAANALVAVEGNGKWVVEDHGNELPRNFCGAPPTRLELVKPSP